MKKANLKIILLIVFVVSIFFLSCLKFNFKKSSFSSNSYKIKYSKIRDNYFLNSGDLKDYINNFNDLFNEAIQNYLNHYTKNIKIKNFNDFLHDILGEHVNFSIINSLNNDKIIVIIQIFDSATTISSYNFIFKRIDDKYNKVENINISNIIASKKLTHAEISAIKLNDENNKLYFITFGEIHPSGHPIRGSTLLWEWEKDIKPIWWKSGSGKYNKKKKELLVFYCYNRYIQEDEYTEIYKFENNEFKLIKQ